MLRCTNGHDRCYLGPNPGCPYCERVPAPTQGGLFLNDDGSPRTIEAVESALITVAVVYYRGQLSAVARALGIGRSTLYRKLKKYNIKLVLRV